MTEESPEEDHGSPGVAETNPGSPSSKNNNNNKEQDRFLPIANDGRIMKKFSPVTVRSQKTPKKPFKNVSQSSLVSSLVKLLISVKERRERPLMEMTSFGPLQLLALKTT